MADRRTRPTRGPATTRRTAGSRASAVAVAERAAAGHRAARRGPVTARAFLLGSACLAVLVMLAVPVRELIHQRADINRLRAQATAQRRAVADLQKERARLQDPAYIKEQARRRLHFRMPGETTVVVIGAGPGTQPTVTTHGRAKVEVVTTAPWYSRLWASDVAAGASKPDPAPKASSRPGK